MTKKSVFNFFLSSTYLSYLFSCRIVFTDDAIADLDSLIPDLRNNLEAAQQNFVVRGKNSFIWVLYNEDDLQPAANGAALQIETAGIGCLREGLLDHKVEEVANMKLDNPGCPPKFPLKCGGVTMIIGAPMQYVKDASTQGQ